MGKLILCSGILAKDPFHFQLTNTNIYSLEELCYYIYNNIYVITEEVLGYDLVHWLQVEAKMEELAVKLENLIKSRNSLKDKIVTVLCAADYYTEEEIIKLIKVIDHINHLPVIKRQKIEADNFVKYGKYQAAAREYASILRNKEASIFTEKEFGDIMHNQAVIMIHTGSTREAAETYKDAYKYNHNEDTLKSFLMALKVGRYEREFEKAAMEYNINPELMLEIDQEIKEKSKEAKDSPAYLNLKKIGNLKTEGKVNEYYNEMNHLIECWKQEYRQGILR